MPALLLLLLVRCGAEEKLADFTSTYLFVTPPETQTAVTFQLSFVPRMPLNASDVVWITLPRFTSGSGTKTPGQSKALDIAPSIYFDATWAEGDFHSEDDPYRNSTLILRVKGSRWVESGKQIDVFVYDTNGIRVYCGFDRASATTRTEGFLLRTNATGGNQDPVDLEDSDIVGNGCEAMLGCLGRGVCDYCTERCNCYEKLGDGDDTSRYGTRSVDCTLTNCPRGLGFSGLPVSETKAHFDVECSNAGLCESQTGNCECFDGFTGIACERQTCFSDCSGHGQCVTMSNFPHLDTALPLNSADDLVYGSHEGQVSGVAWDFNTISGCVCDSKWPVGSDGYDLPEFFGPDCSLQHCESSDDPVTTVDDTLWAASNTTTTSSALRHVDCANRGLCNFGFGKCECFAGFIGSACDRLIQNAEVVRI